MIIVYYFWNAIKGTILTRYFGVGKSYENTLTRDQKSPGVCGNLQKDFKKY